MKPKNIYYISEKDLAERWSISNFTLQQWRLNGKSLPYVKIGRSIRYSINDVEALEDKNTTSPTTDNVWGV